MIPLSHPARSKSDTYYVNESLVLRTHTSAHQNELLSKGYKNFLVTGDVYRKDEIDNRHYPIFHQMEGVILLDKKEDARAILVKILTGLVEYLFPQCEYQFNNDYFPFTNPSYEMEVKFNNNWIEVLGCGVIQEEILKNNGIIDKNGIAFGLGIDRLCMIFFEIPDIRYLWSTDSKFLNQFDNRMNSKFKPYSLLKEDYRDISFWVNSEKWENENDLYELIREVASDLISKVELIDKFYHPSKQHYSRTYRLTYSPNDCTLDNPSDFTKLIDTIDQKLRINIRDTLKIQLR